MQLPSMHLNYPTRIQGRRMHEGTEGRIHNLKITFHSEANTEEMTGGWIQLQQEGLSLIFYNDQSG
jgi:hypothetical protein